MWSVISLREGIIHNTWNSWYRLMNMYSIRKYKVTDWNNKYLISKGATEKRTEKDQKIWSIKFKCKHWNLPTCDCQTEADAGVEKSRLQTSWITHLFHHLSYHCLPFANFAPKLVEKLLFCRGKLPKLPKFVCKSLFLALKADFFSGQWIIVLLEKLYK